MALDLQEHLTKKIGPLPAYGWVAILGVGGFLLIRKRSTAATNTVPAYINSGNGATGGGGSGGGGTVSSPGVPPPVVTPPTVGSGVWPFCTDPTPIPCPPGAFSNGGTCQATIGACNQHGVTPVVPPPSGGITPACTPPLIQCPPGARTNAGVCVAFVQLCNGGWGASSAGAAAAAISPPIGSH